jgi:predicted ATPase
MFGLAQYKDIALAVADARARPNGLRNLLNRVADRATKHMHSVWKEYRGIRIELSPNGPNIEASIRDAFNLYDLHRRSDGFKRFVTFLLMVSARVKSKDLVNTVYLHDEPDTSLHPSGARYLRDELIKISKHNYVDFSTHSIFMVDRELLGRHLIVEKKGEVTSIREVDESNIVDEEVVYNALGHSIFEHLKPRNVIFEGWRDKRLFQVAVKISAFVTLGA